MSEDSRSTSPETLLSAWLKATTDFWTQAISQMPAVDATAADPKATSTSGSSRGQEAMDGAMQTWKFLMALVNNPDTMQQMAQGMQTLPEIYLKAIQSGWSGFFELQQHWLQLAVEPEGDGDAYDFDNLDQETLRRWSQLYEKEFSKFFQLPQIGIARFYQERVGQAADRYNRFQAAMAEFMQMLYLPMEKSVRVLQSEINASAEKGELNEDPRYYYQRWIKILEGHYMTLFQSEEYVQSMSQTLLTLEAFVTARRAVFKDLLSGTPIPTEDDLAALYKEVYQLKKRIKALEKSKA